MLDNFDAPLPEDILETSRVGIAHQGSSEEDKTSRIGIAHQERYEPIVPDA